MLCQMFFLPFFSVFSVFCYVFFLSRIVQSPVKKKKKKKKNPKYIIFVLTERKIVF